MYRVAADSVRTLKNLGVWVGVFGSFMLWPYFIKRSELWYWQDRKGAKMAITDVKH